MTTRKSDRVPTQLPVQVSCETWTDFVDLYTADISHGGMFIQSTSAPELYSKVTVVLRLPGDVAELALPGEVVHVIAPERRGGSGGKHGFGVHLGDLDDETRRAVETLVRYAKAQMNGEGEDGAFVLEAVAESGSDRTATMASGEEYRFIMELREQLADFKELDDMEALGLEDAASVAEVRSAFFEATKQWHPDRYQRCGQEVRSLATQIFIRIKKAYTTLSDPKKLEACRAARAPRAPQPPARTPAPDEQAEAAAAATPAPPPESPAPQAVPTPAPTPASPPPQAAPPPAAASPSPQAPQSPPPESRRRPKKRPKPSPLAKKFMRSVLEQSSKRGSGATMPTGSGRAGSGSARLRGQPGAAGAEGRRDKQAGAATAEARIAQALTLSACNRFGDAIEILRGALETAPGHRGAKVLLALCEARHLASQGKREAAVAKYEAALKLDPKHAEAKRELDEVKRAVGSEKGRGLFSRILTRQG